MGPDVGAFLINLYGQSSFKKCLTFCHMYIGLEDKNSDLIN